LDYLIKTSKHLNFLKKINLSNNNTSSNSSSGSSGSGSSLISFSCYRENVFTHYERKTTKNHIEAKADKKLKTIKNEKGFS
jgi:hypothetical protein